MSRFANMINEIPKRERKYKPKKYSCNSIKRNNVYILTNDGFYFIIEKFYLRDVSFFSNLFSMDYTAGNLSNPIFLQKVNKHQFDIMIQYIKHYHNKDDTFQYNEVISINDLYGAYNSYDRDFIKSIEKRYKYTDEEFMDLIKMCSYIGVDSLYQKIKYARDFFENIARYKVEDLYITSDEEDYLSD